MSSGMLDNRMASLGNLRQLFFQHDYVKNAYQRISDFHQISMGSGNSDFMLLYGESGSGKTSLVSRYRAAFNGGLAVEEAVGVLYISVPSKCTPKALAEAILASIGDPMATRGTLHSMSLRAAHYIEHRKVSLIVLDEFQHFINKRNMRVAYDAADWLKSLSNYVSCPFLAVGLPMTTEILMKNEQLERRVVASVEMPAFPLFTKKDKNLFKRLLAAFAQELPFENPEFLVGESCAVKIHQMTQGLIGRVARLLRLAGEIGVRNGDKILKDTHFDAAFRELTAIERS